ncbi:hypothetical protein [Pseudomonas gingeri]|uniref:hypothetical protein n=1 Tax=Pseudomonas gingeri TaxID=117681 RepID=UPI0015A4C9F7|nr:hypothetical protein [Pseudomonas gingeri]NWA00086.1 hypothetical protein [Pseudomonas gingeri]NWA16925.1 hypothetical protein [Pseudomonas gingeri]NWA53689.1 hypothetical protein [Pseudomonas gingeri]NWA93921.1 hypothetical protein [Pseudomonas gingeri]NWB02179.1 hypothetical protein [Pseudomonas gingeri]
MCTKKSSLILDRKKYTRSIPKEASKPDVELAFPDGLLPISALNEPLAVTFELWADASKDHQYRLLWEGEPFDEYVDVTDDDLANPNRHLKLYVPQEFLVEKNDPENPTDKKYKLSYVIYDKVSMEPTPSFEYLLEIDTTRPGLPSHGPIAFPVQADDGLTSAELTAMGDKLDVIVSSYSTIAVGDIIQTYWGDIEGPAEVVQKEDMKPREVPISFSREFLEGVESEVGSAESPVTYIITDRSGNVSPRSLARQIKLLLADIPNDLPLPIVEQASPEQGGLIDYDDAQSGVTVDIPNYPGAAPGNRITVYWGDTNPLPEIPVQEGDEDKDPILSPVLQFDIINQFPEATVNVKYEVRHNGQLIGTSQSLPVTVYLTLPVPEERLQPLTIQGTSGNPNGQDNLIDPDDYELDARAIFRWTNGLRVNDYLNLHWGQQSQEQWYQITQADFNAGSDLDIPVENSIIKTQGTGAAIPVYYTVTRDTNPNPAMSPTQSVIVRSKMEQPGGEMGLQEPVFTRLSDTGHIIPGLNPEYTPVLIRPYENIRLYHDITLTFEGFDEAGAPIEEARYEKTETINPTNIGTGLTFQVPRANLMSICVGRAQITYRVEPRPEHNQEPANSLMGSAPVKMSRPVVGCDYPW